MFICRSDGKKLLVHFRRPVPRDVRDIGRWTTILSSITVIAVYANAFLIALTSDFIPRLVSDTLTESGAVFKVAQNNFYKIWHRLPYALGV